jgi:hypothetical protein
MFPIWDHCKYFNGSVLDATAIFATEGVMAFEVWQ